MSSSVLLFDRLGAGAHGIVYRGYITCLLPIDARIAFESLSLAFLDLDMDSGLRARREALEEQFGIGELHRKSGNRLVVAVKRIRLKSA